MNVSRRWLEDFLRRQLDPRDVAERLAMLGAPVDSVEPNLDEVCAVGGVPCAAHLVHRPSRDRQAKLSQVADHPKRKKASSADGWEAWVAWPSVVDG